MKRRTTPKQIEVERMSKARQRGRIRATLEGSDAREAEADRARDEAVARNIAWARRQWVLSRPDLSPQLKHNLLNG